MIRDSLLPVRPACKDLEVSKSGYYRWKKREPGPKRDQELRNEILAIAGEFAGYGYRRITATLHRQKRVVNHKKVLRIMREENILCKRKSRKPRTTNSRHGQPTYPNLTRGLVVTRPNQLWVSDITYVGIDEGHVYLAIIIEIFSRKCIGWELSRRLTTPLTLSALDMAIDQRAFLGFKELIHHSDRGSQYASREYVQLLLQHGIQISMTETGNPRENAYAESFMKTLKVEEVYLKEYQSFGDAKRNIKEFIEEVYNAKRLHSSIGYRPPNEMEAEVLNCR